MSQLSLANIINISVATAQSGIGQYNTSNIALFSHETPVSPYVDGYKIYLSASEVVADYATDSETGKMATAIFSQSPNILTGGGYLAVISLLANAPAITAVQKLSFSAVPTVGNYQIGYAGNYCANIGYGADAAAVQVLLRTISGLGSVVVTGNTTLGFTVTMTGVSGPAPLMTVRNNSLDDTDGYNVIITPSTTTVGEAASGDEKIDEAITRTKDLVQYFGITATQEIPDADIEDAAAVVQSLNKMAFFAKLSSSDVAATTGIASIVKDSNYTKTRIILYIGDANESDSCVVAASYAGRALSTNFSGSNTTQTMHMKDLVGVVADSAMTQTILELAKTAGADTYASYQGVPKTFSTGANGFFDEVYNQCWIVGALEVAGFNFLAGSSSKIPQSEKGVDGLKSAYRAVLEQAIENQYCAAGSWTSPDTFGNLEDFHRNIQDRGYYMYSLPVSQQTAADRADRKCPLVQIALKQAGAIHSSSVIVYINA